MDSYDKMRLLYLGLLLIAIVGGLLMRSKGRMGQRLRQFGLWMVIIGGVSFGVATIDGSTILPFQSSQVTDAGQIELKRQRDGHYHLTAEVNGAPIRFIVDTGATDIVLTREDARRVGIDTDDLRFIGSAATANGVVRTAPVWLNTIAIDSIQDQNIRAIVSEGDMSGSLLGMSYLNRFSKIEIANNTLTLSR